MLFIILLSCKKEDKVEFANIHNLEYRGLKCNLSQAENAVFELDEVKKKYNLIDSISNHKEGISFMSDSLELNGIQFFEIRVGYNSELRFESYYTFYVEKENCSNIKIFEPIEGKIITLNDWRNLEKQNNNESLLAGVNKIKKINLPFSFYSYFKDEYSDLKYPNYKPSEKLKNFLISKDYEGEEYKCFVLSEGDKCKIYVVSVLRGDSEYFLLLTASNNSIIDFREIGEIGGENPITFVIQPDLTIEKYNGNSENNDSLIEKLKIESDCKIK